MFQPRQSAVRNRLLAALPPDDFAALAPALRPVDLDFRQTLHRPDRPLEAAYFPERGMVSMLAPLDEGQTMEVGIVGREGLVGLPVVLGADSATTQGSRTRNHKLNRTRFPKTEHPGWRSKASESALQRAPLFHLIVYLTAS